MKTLVSIFACDAPEYAFAPLFNGFSAFQRVCQWIQNLSVENKCGKISEVLIITDSFHENTIKDSLKEFPLKYSLEVGQYKNYSNFLSLLSSKLSGYDTLIHSLCSCPFYDFELTEKLYELHKDTAAEYTFAEGWPEGLAPSIINAGTVSILSALPAKNTSYNVGQNIFFDLISSDINSFEVETLIAPEDMRQYRLNFECNSKEKTVACVNLFNFLNEKKESFQADNLSAKAIFTNNVLRTVPCFYNIQISSFCGGTCSYCPYPSEYEKKYGHKTFQSNIKNPKCYMSLDKFKDLAKNISDFSSEAVVSLSLWGEPLAHPNFIEFVKALLQYSGLSVLIETDGQLVTPELAETLSKEVVNCKERTNGYKPIIWIISKDALDQNMYETMRGKGSSEYPVSLKKAEDAVEILKPLFPDAVYTQFLRTKYNEEQLKAFYHSHKETGGMIIQKYDNFAGLMPDLKVTDLSPLVRGICWHQRRDMVILVDGSVPFCREYMLDNHFGNVFSESLESIWDKGKAMEFCEKCRNCDEYYTFNF
ncbi:MAG: spiro-SPASM protein [Spirochaetaceae bacterium]|nr:spiro-SPASM protein [Spirochaetaceae bacterium]